VKNVSNVKTILNKCIGKNKESWFTVSKNPKGFLGKQESWHVEPGKTVGHFHVKASNKTAALKKITKGKINLIAKGYIPR
jgi:hypothetical protein